MVSVVSKDNLDIVRYAALKHQLGRDLTHFDQMLVSAFGDPSYYHPQWKPDRGSYLTVNFGRVSIARDGRLSFSATSDYKSTAAFSKGKYDILTCPKGRLYSTTTHWSLSKTSNPHTQAQIARCESVELSHGLYASINQADNRVWAICDATQPVIDQILNAQGPSSQVATIRMKENDTLIYIRDDVCLSINVQNTTVLTKR